MVSEDSGCASSVHSPVATASVHGERFVHQCGETLVREVLSSIHRPDDAGEDEEVSLFRAQEGCVSKNGMTLVSRSSLRRTTNTSVVSALAR